MNFDSIIKISIFETIFFSSSKMFEDNYCLFYKRRNNSLALSARSIYIRQFRMVNGRFSWFDQFVFLELFWNGSLILANCRYLQTRYLLDFFLENCDKIILNFIFSKRLRTQSFTYWWKTSFFNPISSKELLH